MNAYFSSQSVSTLLLALLLVWVPLAAFAISRLSRWLLCARVLAWLLTVSSTVAAERITAEQSGSLRMIAIVLALLWSLKAVVSVEEQVSGREALSGKSWFAFALGWLGMRPSVFARTAGKPLEGWRELVLRGLSRLLCGTALVALAGAMWHTSPRPGWESLWFTASSGVLLTGLSLTLHFGLLNLLAGIWRRAGADCRALFRAPLYATSLAEFWSRRWNLAFSEMATLALFRPLQQWAGPRLATVCVFLFSGLLHELAISLPVRAGFGLPMAYFTLHAVAVQLEQGLARLGWAVDRSAWVGRLWTAAWVLLPLPFLFHAPFLRGCLWPLLV